MPQSTLQTFSYTTPQTGFYQGTGTSPMLREMREHRMPSAAPTFFVDGTAARVPYTRPVQYTPQKVYEPFVKPFKRTQPRRRQHLQVKPQVWLRVGLVICLTLFSFQGLRALVTQSMALAQGITVEKMLEQASQETIQKEQVLDRSMQQLRHPSYQERLARQVLGYVNPYEVSVQLAL
ncbi:MAG: hypothetical protein ACKO37_03615 [Vampirovibrionales bacterium]